MYALRSFIAIPLFAFVLIIFAQDANAQVQTHSDTAVGKGIARWDKGLWPAPGMRSPFDAIAAAIGQADVALQADLNNIRASVLLLGLPVAERLGEKEWRQNWNDGLPEDAPNPIKGFFRQKIEIDYIPWGNIPGILLEVGRR